jgi:general secretion pathway protein G
MYTDSRKYQYGQEGFSLLEIMIAVLIMGLLAAVGVPALWNFYQSTKRTGTETSLRAFKSAINLYNARVGNYPSSLRDLVRPPVDEKVRKRWTDGGGPFLEKEVEEDSWGNPFVYRLTPGLAHPYELYSKGKDGADTPESRISVWDI